MSYTSNIPLGSQTVASTQVPINNNFTIANTAFGIDHTSFVTGGVTQGQHQKLTLVQQSGNPAAIATSPILYCKSTTSNTLNNDIYFIRASNDASSVVQLTTTKVNPAASTNGSSFLPGGIMIQWGTVNGAVNGTVVNYPTAFPTAVFSVTATVRSNSTSKIIAVFNTGIGSFTVALSSGSDIQWMAIGN